MKQTQKTASRQSTVVDPQRGLPASLQASLGYAVRRAQIHAYQHFAAVMGPADVRPAQFALLTLIHQHPGLPQSAAGELLGIEKGNLTGLLLELGERGWTERHGSPVDRRAYSLHLTARGKTQTRRLIRQHEKYEAAIAARLSAAERAELMSLLAKLVSKA